MILHSASRLTGPTGILKRLYMTRIKGEVPSSVQARSLEHTYIAIMMRFRYQFYVWMMNGLYFGEHLSGWNLGNYSQLLIAINIKTIETRARSRHIVGGVYSGESNLLISIATQ